MPSDLRSADQELAPRRTSPTRARHPLRDLAKDKHPGVGQSLNVPAGVCRAVS